MDPVTATIVAAAAAGTLGLGATLASRRRARQRRDEAALRERTARGAIHARSLHPVIDPDVCIGSLSCLKACPEGDILGVVGGAARLVHADHCIGHGRCASECPVGAIRLVFGSAERGVDLPEVDAFFESSRPGVHVVGELGGMGLIKNAIVQGLQVAERLADLFRPGGAPVAVVGAGPAGLATALGLKARRVPHELLEQGTVGGSVAHYPRHKVAMTEPVQLPLYGRFGKRLITKEELLATWRRLIAKTGLEVNEGVKVTGITGADGRFTVETEKGSLAASKVVLAIGRRGTPRKLGVSGEEQPKVVYGLTDPEQYTGAKVLVVGGGDAALEAAIALAEQGSGAVAISYRGAEFARCREANRKRIDALVQSRRLEPFLASQVREIGRREVLLEAGGRTATLPNDYVVVNVGGELPLDFLAKVGVSMRRYHGEAPGAPEHGDEAKTARRRLVQARERAEQRRRRLIRILYAAGGVSILAFLAWVGREYYPLARAERLASPLHPSLKSAGPWGHGVGIAATLFMLSNFLYALRKHWKRLDRLGGIRGWLDFHVFVGFMSPLVIAFHAAFQSNNLLATGTAAALGVVVATGIVGRFIYGVVPSERGKAEELEDLLGRFERIRGDLSAESAAGPAARGLVAHVTAPVKAGSFALLFLALPFEAVAVRLRLLSLFRSMDREGRRRFREEVLALSRLRWQIRFYASLKRLLRGWRAFHATLAVFLVLAITAHIGLSLYLGYGLLRR